MTIKELFLAELDRESERSRHALAEVPEGKHDWKPSDKSMTFGNLYEMIAAMPGWIEMLVTQDELDIAPATPRPKSEPKQTSAELLKVLEEGTSRTRAALEGTSDAHLDTSFTFLARGKQVASAPRHEMITDMFNHMAHHRGQMTVYLRLLGARVPAIYGPSADDQRFG